MREKEYEKEIELADFIRVVGKRKIQIVAGALICGMIATLIVMWTPEIYSIHTAMQPGVLDVRDSGKLILTDALPNIKAVIASGAFREEISKKIGTMNVDEFYKNLDLKLTPDKKPRVLEMVHQTRDVEVGIEAMNQLSRCVAERYDEAVEMHRRIYDTRILAKKNGNAELDNRIGELESDFSAFKAENREEVKKAVSTIENIEGRIKVKTSRVNGLKESLSEIKAEIERVKRETDDLLRRGNEPEPGEAVRESTFASALYADAIRENNKRVFELGRLITNTTVEIESLEAEIDNKKNEIKDAKHRIDKLTAQSIHEKKKMDLEIENLENAKRLKADEIRLLEMKRTKIRNIRILYPPSASLSPQKTNKAGTFGIFFVLGLAMMILLALFLEYIEQTKTRVTP